MQDSCELRTTAVTSKQGQQATGNSRSIIRKLKHKPRLDRDYSNAVTALCFTSGYYLHALWPSLQVAQHFTLNLTQLQPSPHSKLLFTDILMPSQFSPGLLRHSRLGAPHCATTLIQLQASPHSKLLLTHILQLYLRKLIYFGRRSTFTFRRPRLDLSYYEEVTDLGGNYVT